MEAIGIRNAVQTIQHVVVLREPNGPFHDEFDEFGDFALELGVTTRVDSHEEQLRFGRNHLQKAARLEDVHVERSVDGEQRQQALLDLFFDACDHEILFLLVLHDLLFVFCLLAQLTKLLIVELFARASLRAERLEKTQKLPEFLHFVERSAGKRSEERLRIVLVGGERVLQRVFDLLVCGLQRFVPFSALIQLFRCVLLPFSHHQNLPDSLLFGVEKLHDVGDALHAF